MSFTLSSLVRFVESHGFRARVVNGAVCFEVPFVTASGATGSETQTVRTLKQARNALGY